MCPEDSQLGHDKLMARWHNSGTHHGECMTSAWPMLVGGPQWLVESGVGGAFLLPPLQQQNIIEFLVGIWKGFIWHVTMGTNGRQRECVCAQFWRKRMSLSACGWSRRALGNVMSWPQRWSHKNKIMCWLVLSNYVAVGRSCSQNIIVSYGWFYLLILFFLRNHGYSTS
jgi:hypothetical protein